MTAVTEIRKCLKCTGKQFLLWLQLTLWWQRRSIPAGWTTRNKTTAWACCGQHLPNVVTQKNLWLFCCLKLKCTVGGALPPQDFAHVFTVSTSYSPHLYNEQLAVLLSAKNSWTGDSQRRLAIGLVFASIFLRIEDATSSMLPCFTNQASFKLLVWF